MDINQESILGSFLPNVYITKITLNDDRVQLSLMIKENIEDDEELSYLNNDFLKEFINISIIQSIDEKITNNLADNFLVEKNKFDPRMSKVRLNLKTSKNSRISYDEEGNREIYYEQTFFLNASEIEHLSYFVFCEINELEIRKKFKLKSSVRMSFSPNKITNELVILDGKVTEDSYVYLLPDGSLWAGAVRERGIDQYITVESSPRSLQRNVINNYKVQDFRSRTIKTLSPSSIQIDNILSQEGEEIINSSFNRQILKNYSKTKSFIYDIYHSYNSDNSISINFKINFSELLKQNSPYPNLVNENSTYPELNDGIIANTEIINARLYRRQVKTSINKFKNKPIDIKEPEVIIFSGIPEELNTGLPNNDIKQYYITDLDIKDKLAGEYQYYLLIEFKDGIIEFLRIKLTSLIENYTYLKNYYNSCLLVQNYDADTDSFTDDLSREYSIDDIAILVNTYISTLAQVYNLNQSETDKLQKTLSLFTSPTLGNPKGVLYFISLYDNLITKLSEYVSINNNNSISDSNSYSSPKETILIKKELNEVIDANILNTIKIEYLPINNGIIDLNSFRERIKNEIARFDLNNTNIYNNELSTCYLSPSKIILENKEYDMLLERSEQENSILRTQIQCLNKEKTVTNKILENVEEDQKIRNFFNLRNILSEQGVVFEYLKITGSSVVLDDIEYKNIQLSDVENQDNFIKINPKIYDIHSDLEAVYNEYNVQKLKIQKDMPNQLIKFNDLSLEQKNINSANNLFNYFLIAEIQYLDGEEWKLLTDSELDRNIKEPGTKVINCRLKKYIYSKNSIKQQNLIKYIYNEYFIIDLDLEITDNFIDTAIPNIITSLSEQQIDNQLSRTLDIEIEEVLPKIKYFNPVDGDVDEKEIIIKGNNFKKGLEVYIFKDKINKNNLIFKGNTKTKNSQVALINSKEIRIKMTKIDNYKNLIDKKTASILQNSQNLFRNFLFIKPQEIDTIIIVRNLKNKIAEYKDFKLSAELPIKKILPTPENSKKPVTHFDNKDKIRGIMDIGLGIKRKNVKNPFDKTLFDDIVDNITPISKKDLVKNNMKDKIKNLPIGVSKDVRDAIMPKPTAPEINVKNISSNSKIINLYKEEIKTDLETINTEDIKKASTLPIQKKVTVEQELDIKPQPKTTQKQTIKTNKIKNNPVRKT